jgi:hypothetical protein
LDLPFQDELTKIMFGRRLLMKSKLLARPAATASTFGAIVLVGTMLVSSPQMRADNNQGNDDESRIQQGFAIAPVPLNLAGKNHDLVGLGSYIVNAQADCNGCHTAGQFPNFNYASGGNPYFNQKQVVDPTVYLSGGQFFGFAGTPTGPFGYSGPPIISRNLTPDKNGRPEGGHTLSDFKQILRHGTDFDHIHPTCTPDQLTAIEGGATPVCIPTSPDNPVDGDLLQVMPWPTFSLMSDHDIEAIYEYLSAIPCIDNTTIPGPPGAPDELRNDCGNGPAAPADREMRGPRAPQSRQQPRRSR